MDDFKILLFFFGTWATAMFGMEVYFMALMNERLQMNGKKHIVHCVAISLMAFAAALYVVWYYPEIVTEGRRIGPWTMVGMITGLFGTMIFNPVYEAFQDFQRGDFD